MVNTLTEGKDSFSIGDRVKVVQIIKEKDKERQQIFDGIVISIKGSNTNKTFTVRRIGEQGIGIEKIFPLNTPFLKQVKVVRAGGKGSRSAKLYYIRNKSKKEIEKIYKRASRKK